MPYGRSSSPFLNPQIPNFSIAMRWQNMEKFCPLQYCSDVLLLLTVNIVCGKWVSEREVTIENLDHNCCFFLIVTLAHYDEQQLRLGIQIVGFFCPWFPPMLGTYHPLSGPAWIQWLLQLTARIQSSSVMTIPADPLKWLEPFPCDSTHKCFFSSLLNTLMQWALVSLNIILTSIIQRGTRWIK